MAKPSYDAGNEFALRLYLMKQMRIILSHVREGLNNLTIQEKDDALQKIKRIASEAITK